MSMKKTQFAFIVRTQFYPIKRLAELYGMPEKELAEKALIAEALYRIRRRVFVNRFKLEKFLIQTETFEVDRDGKYCQLGEAVRTLGIGEDKVMQLASDADALIQMENTVLINLDALDEYILECKKKVCLITEEELETIVSRKDRREKEYV